MTVCEGNKQRLNLCQLVRQAKGDFKCCGKKLAQLKLN